MIDFGNTLNRNLFDKERDHKINFDGKVSIEGVYRIPIGLLFFNDENGRISTYISKAKSENFDLEKLDIERYNDTLAEYIKESEAKEVFKNTKQDILNKGQLVPGVVLSDGRIIDGNRRFTCIRELYKETRLQKFAYFEAIILDKKDNDNFKKAITSLELEIQIGTNEKVDYSPIDWLVRVYKNLVVDRLYTDLEFSLLTNKKKNEIDKDKTKALIMVDFLEFFNKKDQFHIAKQLKLDGPLQELVSLKKTVPQKDWDKYKVIFYVFMYETKGGDKTRIIRELKKKWGTTEFDKLRITYENKYEFIVNKKPIIENNSENNNSGNNSESEGNNNNSSNPNNNSNNKPLTIENCLDNQKKQDAIEKPIKVLKSISKNLTDIDYDILKKIDKYSEKYNEIKSLIENIENQIKELKKNVA